MLCNVFLIMILVFVRCFKETGICCSYISKKLHAQFAFKHTKSTPSDEIVACRAQDLTDCLGCTLSTARLILRRTKTSLLDNCDVRKSAEFCKNNFPIRDVIENPLVMTVSYAVLDQRFSTLRELGYKSINVQAVLQFAHIMKQTPKALEKNNVVAASLDSYLNVLGQVKYPGDLQQAIKSKVQQMWLENHTLEAIKAKVNAEFLSWRLECPVEKLEKPLKKSSMLLKLSTESIEATYELLTKKLGFSQKKIINSLYLLTLNSADVENFLLLVPDVLGLKIELIAKKHPNIFRKSPESLKKIEVVLKDFEISEKQLLCCPKVLNLKHSTVRHRLKYLHQSEDFKLFKNNRSFLWLIYNQKHLSQRLKRLKSLNVPYSLSMFMVASTTFERRLKLSQGQTYAKDIAQCLSEMYSCSEKSVKRQLRNYPIIYCCPILNAHKVMSFLLDHGVSREQLWNGLGIIAYDLEVVEKYFNHLPHHEEFQPFSEWAGHFNLIQLLIYMIEKNRNSAEDYSSEKEFNMCENGKISDHSEIECFRDDEIDHFSDEEQEEEDDEEKELSDMYNM